MLVLARKHGQSIFVGDNIEITVVEVRGDVVRLGIDAPGAIPVYRKEVWERIKAENEAAAESVRLAGGA
ncbi:MAG: carbon storage regulator CsrA [Armatimonadota bacterium]|nr:carbon storage regulator CsrA [Armatimonadota bacterium]